MRIGDLIEVPEIKTVIQLKDLQDSHLQQMILHSFVVTGEVQDSLERILTSFSQPEGRGVFLKGHFGSGKSHFLSMLSLLLRHAESWKVLLDQAPSLENLRKNLRSRRFLVAEISLIQHRSTEFLEDIFLPEIFRELSAQLHEPFEGTDSRQGTFAKIQKTLRDLDFSGMVLLVDELSEFLRSKTATPCASAWGARTSKNWFPTASSATGKGAKALFTKFSNRCGAIFLLFRLRKRGFPSSTRSIRPPSLSWTASSLFFPNIGASWISSTTG